MKITKFVLAAFVTALFASCDSNDDQPPIYTPLGKYDSGVLILNQGGFGHGDASISYLSSNFSQFENDIFSLNNEEAILGDTAQDIAFYGPFAYVVLNGSNKIEIVNRYTMKSMGTIDEGLSNPRYMVVYNGKGYVTNWGDGSNPSDDYVAVINLATASVVSNIPVAEGPERIIEHNGKLYIAQTGGYGFGNQISVINTANNAVSTITVGDVPNGLQVKDGFLWVSYGGKPSFAAVQTAGGLVKINLSTNAIANTYGYSDVTKHVSNLAINGNYAYYTVDAGIYKYELGSAALPAAPAFSTTAQGVYGVYSFAIRNGHFFVGDAVDYTNPGKVYIYSLGGPGQSAIGTLENSFTVGVIPAGFYFNL